ncbi:hypothetical protein FNV43_RR10960 [Rhamnella rubrinervis]|uniref:Uncharacterized protein n=1 Tax=Rhamnella rubrinervis TaxID=2594499 RepID=A0A8K0H5E4_9ROSA|nr:hypothetical protein FNV43_RR10960 [Rhamnella rubrinervis]
MLGVDWACTAWGGGGAEGGWGWAYAGLGVAKERRAKAQSRLINVEEEYVYSLNNEIPIPPIKKKKRAKEKVDQVQEQYSYYYQEATPVIDDGHTSFSSYNGHYHSDHEGKVLDATNFKVDADNENSHHQFSVNEGDGEFQFVTPSRCRIVTYD